MEFGPGIDDPDDEPSLTTPEPGQPPSTLAQPTPPMPDPSPEGQDDIRYPDVVVQLTGEDGNAFAILGTVRRALRQPATATTRPSSSPRRPAATTSTCSGPACAGSPSADPNQP